MNAHINRDLPLALCQLYRELGQDPGHGSPQYRDYERVTAILENAYAGAKEEFGASVPGAMEGGVLRRTEDAIDLFNIRIAREAAWNNARVLWTLRGFPTVANEFIETLDKSTGLATRALLIPMFP